MTTTTAPRIRKADLPEGYSVERQEWEVPCDHYACDTIHRHLYNSTYADGQRILVTLYSMAGDEIGSRWETRFHMAKRSEWIVLLDGERVGDAHDTQQAAYAEALYRKPTV